MNLQNPGRRPRIVVVVDTPNVTKSVIDKHGSAFRPSYRSILRHAKSLGLVTAAVALVNDGVNPGFTNELRAIGYQVELSHAFDCDDAVVAWAVRLHPMADCFLICSGDHGYCDLVRLLKAVHLRVVLSAVAGCCNRQLRELSDEYIEVPRYQMRKSHVRTDATRTEAVALAG